MANHYYTSSGERLTKQVVDARIRRGKALFKEQFIDEHGYVFCQDCARNKSEMIDISHEISVDRCQKEGKTELAWDPNNMRFRHRSCHQIHDNSGLIPSK